jgi:site-specific DNA recombinase
MQFIRQDAVETAFMTMMNKLAYAHRRILHPLRDALRRVDDVEGYRNIEELENQIDAVLEREQVLSGLMAKGYLEPVLYGSEKNELATELEELKNRKDTIIRSLSSSMANADAVNELLKFTAKAEMVTAFDEEVFGRFVEKIEVYSRSEVGFVLKCGLTLKERLVG